MTRQYPLPLPHHIAMGVDDYYVSSCNQEAYHYIINWPNWPAPYLTLMGEEGCGKSHLARIAEANSKGLFLNRELLTTFSVTELITRSSHFILDGLDAILNHQEAEEGLFHLFNQLRSQKGTLLMTTRAAPHQLSYHLPDLKSRLVAAPLVNIKKPDDPLLLALLMKQFRDRQLQIDSNVLDYIMPRITRTTQAVRNLVTAIDHSSMAEKRAITVALVRDILNKEG